MKDPMQHFTWVDFGLKTAIRISKLLCLRRSPLETMRISLDHNAASRSPLDMSSFQCKHHHKILGKKILNNFPYLSRCKKRTLFP